MNELEPHKLDTQSFSFRDLIGQDKWTPWTPVFGSLTVVGATSYSGRWRVVGRQCFFEVAFSAATSIASTAGTDYLNLPLTANAGGLAGAGQMTNSTTKVGVGVCHLDVAGSRCYLPTQLASANVFNLAGWYEV